MKLAVLYDSKSGNTKQAAEWIAAGMGEAEGVEARAYQIGQEDADFVREARGAVIGCPVYAALMTPDMRTWLMGAGGKYAMAGKLGGAFATARFVYGGSELVIQNINKFLIFWGMLVYAGGTALGKPPIHTGPSAINGLQEEFITDTFRLYGQRMAEKAAELFG